MISEAVAAKRARVRLTPGAVRLGGPLHVEWRFTGRSDVLRQVRVWLEGREIQLNSLPEEPTRNSFITWHGR